MGNIRSKNLDWVPEYAIPLLDPEGSLVTRMSMDISRVINQTLIPDLINGNKCYDGKIQPAESLHDEDTSLLWGSGKALLRQAHPRGDKVGGHSGSRPADTCEKAAKADKTLSF